MKKSSKISLTKVRCLEKLVEEANAELKDTKKKNVYLDQFTYNNHRGELVTTNNVSALLSQIREFAMEKREG